MNFIRSFLVKLMARCVHFTRRAEAHRNQHAGTASWIKYYYGEAGIELFPKLILSELRALISEKQEAAVEAGSRCAQRVAIVSEAFAFTEGFAEYHAARQSLGRILPRNTIQRRSRMDQSLFRRFKIGF